MDRQKKLWVIRELASIFKWLSVGYWDRATFEIKDKGALSIILFINYSENGFFRELYEDFLNILTNTSVAINIKNQTFIVERFRRLRVHEYERALRRSKVSGYTEAIDFDTPENRFLVFFINKILTDLISLNQRLPILVEELQNPPWNIHILRSQIQRWISKFSSLKRFRVVSELLQLQSLDYEMSGRIIFNPFYRRLWEKFKDYSGSLYDGDAVKLDILLFEDWRFFELYILFTLRDVLRDVLRAEPVFNHRKVNLSSEITSLRTIDRFFYEWEYLWNVNDLGIRLYYQKIIHPDPGEDIFSISTVLRPDFILRISDNLFVFDTKYKSVLMDRDLQQMHVYRDAVRMLISKEDKVRYKKVVRLGLFIVPDIRREAGERLRKFLDRRFIRRSKMGAVREKDIKDLIRRIIRRYNSRR